MSKTILAGVLGGVTLVTGLLFYGIYLRDKEQNITLETDENEKIEKKEEKEEKTEKEIKPVSKKRKSTTSRNFQTNKSNTKRNRK